MYLWHFHNVNFSITTHYDVIHNKPQVNDTLDDIFDGSDDEEESQDIVNQVLDEIGIEISGKMAKAPSAARSLPSASTSKATISDEEIERQLKALGVD
ncbi:Charged multivesicular body protein 2b [Saguinus oedipus]|uniref:Charged multivesicular body protein 2b n=1 Tax=Saguinus oedipus TaxID=9490 RepID=A0ABQ9TY06_SAGOE|nr:Charged multivesicular body protein 2b [Saguinus oedipus]